LNLAGRAAARDKRGCLSLSLICLLGATLPAFAGQGAASTAPPASAAHKATVDRYCVTCHNDRLKTAGLALDRIDIADPKAAPEVWEKVVRKVRVGMMPPQGAPAIDAATRQGLVSYLTTRLDAGSKRMAWIPPGFAHGFLVLSEQAEFIYKTTDYYAPQHERTLLWNDPALGIRWPLEGQPILSAKDADAPPLAARSASATPSGSHVLPRTNGIPTPSKFARPDKLMRQL